MQVSKMQAPVTNREAIDTAHRAAILAQLIECILSWPELEEWSADAAITSPMPGDLSREIGDEVRSGSNGECAPK